MSNRSRKLVLISRSGGIYEPSCDEDSMVSFFQRQPLIPGWYFKVVNGPSYESDPMSVLPLEYVGPTIEESDQHG